MGSSGCVLSLSVLSLSVLSLSVLSLEWLEVLRHRVSPG
jgi:hypothetical protein